MNKIYNTVGHIGAFGGVEKLRRATNASRKATSDFLSRSDVYTQFRPTRKRFVRRQIIAHGKNELFQADLADFAKYARHNAGFRFVLVVIDVLSKFVFYIPIKNKKSSEMQRAFNIVFRKAKPKLLHTDQGTEFCSTAMQSFFKQKGIRWYYTYSGTKAALAERQIRTLKETLTRIFYYTGSYRYLRLLPKLANAYNHTKHSRTGMAPIEINQLNEQLIFKRLYGGPRRTSNKPKFVIGDQVRISKIKDIFAKGYEQSWSSEIFKVKRIKLSDPIMYYLEDLSGEELLGGFYTYEIARVVKMDTDSWDIEKVIRKQRGSDGKMRYFVKWRGFGNQHNSWISHIHKKINCKHDR